MVHRLLGVLVLGTATAGLAWKFLSPASVIAEPPALAPAGNAKSQIEFQGVASCSASACHNSKARGSEYAGWMTHDPHANAYQLLFDDRSARIVKTLHGPNAAPAFKTGLCLDCHSMHVPESQRGERFSLEDGIGCESCHGPSERWRGVHFLPSWRQKTAEEKEALGMRNTKDLATRARLCVECHIGSAARDVNHDLIAAGHPRLSYENTLYLGRTYRHWNQQGELARHPDFHARTWLVGQAESARAALELLAHRARGALEGKRPWPEFAEYDCFACHKNLSDSSWREAHAPVGRKAGTLPLSTWHYSLLPLLDKQVSKPAEPRMDELRRLMSAVRPDAQKVAFAAEAAAKDMHDLSRTLSAGKYDAGKLQELLKGLVQPERDAALGNWNDAAQRYLAMAAVYRGLIDLDPKRRDPQWEEGIKALLKPLPFPVEFRNSDGFEPKLFRSEVRNLRERIRTWE